ncbi:MAG: hypothetical protein H8E40_09100 [Chloroflexi bacterium]|nr:hypothetical protein [Chloroflexota bacterium]
MNVKSKKENQQHELQKLIVKLTQRVAQVNKLTPNQKQVGDVVVLGNKKQRHAGIMRKIGPGGSDSSWVLVDRDELLWDEVIAKLSDQSRGNVSLQGAEKKLDSLVWKYHSQKWQLSGIKQDVSALMDSIKNQKTNAGRVHLPIWGLVVKIPVFSIGNVKFVQRIDYPKIDEDLREMELANNEHPMDRIHTVALTETTGADVENIVQKAEIEVNRALNILRAFVYPIGPGGGMKQIGIMGTFYSLRELHLVEIFDANTKALLSESSHTGWTGIQDVVIDDYMKLMLTARGFYKLNGLKDSPLGRRLWKGAEWLGEATKPDSLESKFLKVAFAVDAMVGEESPDHIPDKGVRARIAERSAFVMSNKYKTRRQVHDDINSYFLKRGALAHGVPKDISQWETEKFGSYARGILSTLLLNPPSEDLREWALIESLKG